MVRGNLEHKVRRTDDLTSQKTNIKTSHKVIKIIFRLLNVCSLPHGYQINAPKHNFKHFTEDFLSFSDSSLTAGSSLSLRPGIQNCTKLNKIKTKSLCLTLPPCDILFGKVDLFSIPGRRFPHPVSLFIVCITLGVFSLYFIMLFLKCCL